MASRATLVVVSIGAWLSVGPLGGCNAILDIQQAQLAASTSSAGAGGALPVPGDADSCKADNTPCSTCISAKCTPIEQGECTSDEGCRKVGDEYARCLGAGCKADDLNCFEPIFGGASAVPTCVAGCTTECAAVPVYSACELYCGCMLANCSNKFDTVQDCIAVCKNLPAEVVNCRRTHCDIAPHDSTLPHCDHAMGVQTCGTTDVPTRTAECRDKSLKGFYCAADSDCCSNACDPAKKACVNQ